MGKNPRSPVPVDIVIGKQIRTCRVLRDMSQTDLAKKIGITFQQVQKYENGTSRVAASRLHKIAEVLKVPVSGFFVHDPRAVDIQDEKNEKMMKNWSKLRTRKGRDMAIAFIRVLVAFDF